MIYAFLRAFRDINENRFLNSVAIVTVSLSVLIAGAFSLIWTNIANWMHLSETDIRIVVYLKNGTSDIQRQHTQSQIRGMDGVLQVTYIPKSQALESLREQLQHQTSLLDSLDENPLPDSLEIDLKTGQVNLIETIAERISSLPAVERVEYGQQWMGRFSGLLHLFEFTGVVFGSLFFIASGLIIANTSRLSLYSRSDEVEIMRLVGATDRFITTPFYIQSLIQCICGCCIGLAILYAAYYYMSARLTSEMISGFWQIRFIPLDSIAVITGSSIAIGWIGCFLSMKQFFRN